MGITLRPTIDPTQTNQGSWRVEPFLHVDSGTIFNPLTDLSLNAGEVGYEELVSLLHSGLLPDLSTTEGRYLAGNGWLVKDSADLDKRFFLKYVSMEGTSACNQSCYFCPVSIAPKEPVVMPLDFYEEIAAQLAAYKHTLLCVFMMHYNEPTMDAFLIDRVRILKKYGLTPVLNTNGSALTAQKVDALAELGGVGLLSINLSTMDSERYARDRGKDHLSMVLKNLDYAKHRNPGQMMEITVLGHGDDLHRQTLEEISQRFADTNFTFRYAEIMDRAGHVPFGLHPDKPHAHVRGCTSLGSRPLQHLHITATGICVLCPQDYHYQHVVGDLRKETVAEILVGPELVRLRRLVYGLDEAPEDFLCRKCIFVRNEGAAL